MKVYKVSVEQRFYETSYIIVDADSPDEAIEIVKNKIDKAEIAPADVLWGDDPVYEPGSFTTTGDVENA